MLKDQTREESRAKFLCFKFLSSLFFTLLFKGMFVIVFAVISVVAIFLNPYIFSTASPCRIDTYLSYTIIGVLVAFAVLSILLLIGSVICKVRDVFLIRMEIILDSVAFIICAVINSSFVPSPVTTGNLTNIIASTVYMICNVFLSGIIPTIRSFASSDEEDVYALTTWLDDDEKRAIFKVQLICFALIQFVGIL